MKKSTFYILSFFFFSLFPTLVCGQDVPESLRDRLAKKKQQQNTAIVEESTKIKLPKATLRAEKFNQLQNEDLSHATWVREVYRFLDLKKGKNAALFYPVQPIGDRMNLATMIFRLMAENKLSGYVFNVEDQEVFTEERKVKFDDVLERLEIPFQRSGEMYIFDDFSIPSNEVLGYYLKEAWYFDQSNSMVGVKTIAICPVVFREQFLEGVDLGEGNDVLRQPQFWISYDDIRPYTMMMPIMTSDRNNVVNKTMDDYFKMRIYEGEIYKTTNMGNKLLKDDYKTEEELKNAQKRIENELNGFDKNLWILNDSINKVMNDPKITKPKKTKAPKAKKSSAKSKPVYSTRDIR